MDGELCSVLGSEDHQCIEVQRVRLVDDEPCIIEIDYFPKSYTFLLEQNLEDISLLSLVTQKTGLKPTKFEDHFSIAYASKFFAELLACPQGKALVEVRQSVMTENDEIIYQ